MKERPPSRSAARRSPAIRHRENSFANRMPPAVREGGGDLAGNRRDERRAGVKCGDAGVAKRAPSLVIV